MNLFNEPVKLTEEQELAKLIKDIEQTPKELPYRELTLKYLNEFYKWYIPTDEIETAEPELNEDTRKAIVDMVSTYLASVLNVSTSISLSQTSSCDKTKEDVDYFNKKLCKSLGVPAEYSSSLTTK